MARTTTATRIFALARYNKDGSLDSTFGGGTGWVLTAFPNGSAAANSVAVDGSGNIIVAGYAPDPTSGNTDFAVARYKSNGTLDTAFGGGAVLTAFANGSAEVDGVTVESSGNVVVAGYAPDPTSGDTDFAVARYKSTGVLDTSFGSGTGKTLTPFSNGNAEASSVVEDGSGNIVVAGFAVDASASQDLALARYKTNGALDTAFGGSGTGSVLTPAGAASNAAATGVVMDGSGNILVAGYAVDSNNSFNSDFVVARYLDRGAAQGTLDTTFGGNSAGVVLTPVGTGNAQADSVAVHGDGNIAVAGFALDPTSGNNDFCRRALLAGRGASNRLRHRRGPRSRPSGPRDLRATASRWMGTEISSSPGLPWTAAGNTDFALALYQGAPPVIMLNGAARETVEVGQPYTDPGATVTDDRDSPSTILGSGMVNTAVVADYTLVYTGDRFHGHRGDARFADGGCRGGAGSGLARSHVEQ